MAERSAGEDAFNMLKVERGVLTASLIFTVAVASDFPALADDLFALRAPGLSYIAPPFSIYYLPLLILFLWFNYSARESQEASIKVGPSLISAALLLFSLLMIEALHALRGYEPNIEVILGFAWMILLLFTLRSFSYLVHWRATIIVAASVFCTVLSVLSLVVPVNSLSDLGRAVLVSPDRPEWKGVNSHAYFAAAMSIVAANQFLFARRQEPLTSLFWTAVVAVNILAVVVNQSRGAWIAACLGFAMLLISRITGWTAMRSAIAAALLACLTVGLLLGTQSSQLESVLSLNRGLSSSQELAQSGRAPVNGDVSSVAVRYAMISEAAARFWASPFFGSGWARISEESFGGHSMHGVPQIFSASYGLVGLIVFGIFVYCNFSNPLASRMAIPLIVLMAIEIMARPIIPFWFAIIIALIGPQDRQQALGDK